MEILELIEREARNAGKRFLLIGGHALNVHGIARTTGDIDLMVEKNDLEFWKEFLTRLGYTIFRETSAFLQSRPGKLEAWPLDLMLVSKETMDKALSDSLSTSIFGPAVNVASAGSLIAMKLHALKSNQIGRAQKDQADLFALLELSGLAPDSEAFRQLCLKYGTIELYERLKKAHKP